MTKASAPLTLRGRILVGAVFGGAGAYMIWLSLSDPASVNGPGWLGTAAGMVFMAAGVAGATQGTAMARWTTPLAIGIVFLGLSAIGNWIAFGSGPRMCTGGISIPFFHGAGSTGGLGCRVAFGFGAVIMDTIMVVAALSGLARLVGSPVWSARVESLSTGILGVAVAPLILVAILMSVWSVVREKLWGRRG